MRGVKGDGSDVTNDQINEPYELNNPCFNSIIKSKVYERQAMLIDFIKDIDDPLYQQWPSPKTGDRNNVCS